MRRVFLCSPYAASGTRTVEDNVTYARACLYDSLKRGEAPFAPHLLYPQVLDDLSEREREMGMKAGLEWAWDAGAIAFYIDYGLSPGMTRELQKAGQYALNWEFRSLGYESLDDSGVTLLNDETLILVAHAMGIPTEAFPNLDELRRQVRDWPYRPMERKE